MPLYICILYVHKQTYTIHWQLWTWSCPVFYAPTVCVSLPQLCSIVQTLMAGRTRERDAKDEGNGRNSQSQRFVVESFSFYLCFLVPSFVAVPIWSWSNEKKERKKYADWLGTSVFIRTDILRCPLRIPVLNRRNHLQVEEQHSVFASLQGLGVFWSILIFHL